MSKVNSTIVRRLLRISLAVLLCTAAASTQVIQLDQTFGVQGKATIGFADTGLRSSFARYVFLQPSGRIIVLGAHWSGGQFGTPGVAACALTPAGLLDTGFGTGGKTVEVNGSEIRAFEHLASGQFLRLTALFSLTSLSARLNRVNLNGSIDGSFVADLNIGIDITPVAVAVRPDGKIIVLVRGVGGDESRWLVRLNSNGTRDSSFGANGVSPLNLNRLPRSTTAGLHVLPDNRILLGGYLSTSTAPSGGNVAWAAMLDQNGHYDRRFGVQGVTRLPFAFGIRVLKTLVQPDGKMVLVGSAHTAAGSRLLLVRLTGRGRRDPEFGENGVVVAPSATPGSFDAGYSAVLMTDGRIVTAGSYAASETSPVHFLISRFGTGGSLENHTSTEFTPNQNSFASDVSIQPDGKIVVAGYTRNPDTTADGELFAIARYMQ